MLQQFRQLGAGFQKAVTTRSSSPIGSRARLGLESLEDRSLMSISPVSSLSLAVQSPNTAVVQTISTSNLQNTIVQPLHFLTMANLRNVAFNMPSLDNG